MVNAAGIPLRLPRSMSDRGRLPAPPVGGGSPVSRRPSTSPRRSVNPGQASAPGWSPAMGYDPAKAASKGAKENTRVELPPDAYLKDTAMSMFTLRNNKFNSEGKPIKVDVNQYRMKSFDFAKKVYQYDIAISPDVDKKAAVVLGKIWAHETTKRALANYNYPMWIFDGRKLAWAAVLVDGGELRFRVDLDEGRRPPGAARRDGALFHVKIRRTTEVNMAALQLYLQQKCSFDAAVQAAMNFIDHLVRQFPSQNMVMIKRNFYEDGERGITLAGAGGTIVVHKGVYASVRLSHNLAQGGIGLALNADVANTCFWMAPETVDKVMMRFLAACDASRWGRANPAAMAREFWAVKHRGGAWESSDAFKQLRKLRRLRFKIDHADRQDKDKVYTIKDFAFDQKYGEEGATAKNVKFDYEGSPTSVADYYAQRYKVWLKNPNLPLIDAGKAGFIPMEYAVLQPMQRYPLKLNPEQTAAMIKVAVTRPDVRKADIVKHVAKLRQQQDPYLAAYGVRFDIGFTRTDGRLINPPRVDFGQGSADPKFSGRWDLRGKKFFTQNQAPLQSWAFVAMDACVEFPSLQQFARTFRETFLGHGGKCPAEALLLNLPAGVRHDAADAVAWAHDQMVQQRGYPQLLFVVVAHKNSPHYVRLKKSADCRFGILSQVVNSEAVRRNSGQYHSNVCLKVNAKLGGATSRTLPPWKMQKTYFPKERPTMMVGVDVSHAVPGGNAPSTAAMTMSVDRDATRYAAMVENNGYRQEILLPANVHFLFGQLVKHWQVGHDGQFPRHVIYFRDGVAEGQFAQVLDQEISEIKAFLRNAAPKRELPKFTVVIATKRHHIRLFPERGDKNGNALPGTVVEREVTHPFMWDFYLCSHVAIQGTARPVHYHVILDEMNVPVNDFQRMIYHQCYSYARSTTPVSLHPAVYYAHLAGNRARCHENVASSEGFRVGAKGHEMIRDKVAKGVTIGSMPRPGDEAPPLLSLGGKPASGKAPADGEVRQRDFFRSTMWYI
ncbi:hypothetical protein RJ55_08619 [Drechmeria coniospora]|nr:hypothetical protein RJ55_08619 [Drechmeria coniospora]